MATYFAWLVFVGALLAAPNLLSAVNIVRATHFSWLDAFATCALPFGPAILLGSLVGSSMLVLLERDTAVAALGGCACFQAA